MMLSHLPPHRGRVITCAPILRRGSVTEVDLGLICLLGRGCSLVRSPPAPSSSPHQGSVRDRPLLKPQPGLCFPQVGDRWGIVPEVWGSLELTCLV